MMTFSNSVSSSQQNSWEKSLHNHILMNMKVVKLRAAKGHSSYIKFAARTVYTPKHQLKLTHLNQQPHHDPLTNFWQHLWKFNLPSWIKRKTLFQNYFPTVIYSIHCILQDWEIGFSPRDPRFYQIYWGWQAEGRGNEGRWRQMTTNDGGIKYSCYHKL